MTGPIPVFILSRDRPIYLWACLDALFRHTLHPCRFILADNASCDPATHAVLDGFERRDMFHRLYRCKDNDPGRLAWMLRRHRNELGEIFAYVESDTVVEENVPCWLERFVSLMRANPRLAMLGSCVDPRDFVDAEHGRRLEPKRAGAQIDALIKRHSPERSAAPASSTAIVPGYPNPPGRLLAVRTRAIERTGIAADGQLHAALVALGYETGVATTVRHRHLSLLNIYDYPRYDVEKRADFVGRITGKPYPLGSAGREDDPG